MKANGSEETLKIGGDGTVIVNTRMVAAGCCIWSRSPLGKQLLYSFITDGVAGNEKTTIGIVHQVSAVVSLNWINSKEPVRAGMGACHSIGVKS
jgi:hypothetical protein